MALFSGQPCPLCGRKMTHDEHLFATSHFLGPESDLWEFSDAVIHWDCYAAWEHQARFARLHFEVVRRSNGLNDSWGVAFDDDEMVVSTNPDPLVSEVDVLLAKTGSGFRIPLSDWEHWLDSEWVVDCHHQFERAALSAVLPLLRSKLPTPQIVVSAAKLDGKYISRTVEDNELSGRICYEISCNLLAERAAKKGVTCPGCNTFTTNYEFIRIPAVSESGPQSRLVCCACGKTFGPLDICWHEQTGTAVDKTEGLDTPTN